MDNITIYHPEEQAKFDAELRSVCRKVLTENTSVNKANIGIHPDTLWNQLTDGRVKRIPAVTVALISAYTEDIRPLDELCRIANHVALPIIGINPIDDTRRIAKDILNDLGKMIADKNHRQETGRTLIRRVYSLANRGK